MPFNEPDQVDPAIAVGLPNEYHWRGGTDLEREKTR